jgi:cell division transport system ATP-binding protein
VTHTSDPEALPSTLVRVQRVVIDACPEPVSFNVAAGAAVVVVETRARAGSVILRLLGRISPPRAGRIEVLGHDAAQLTDVQRAALRRRLGVIPRDLALESGLSAFDNLALAAIAAGSSPRDYKAPAEALLAWVGMGRLKDEPAEALDEAGRRRLALARALINRPDLLIADEPAGDLTGDARRGVLKLVAELHAAGTAVLMTSRDEALAEQSGALVVRLEHAEGDASLAGAA